MDMILSRAIVHPRKALFGKLTVPNGSGYTVLDTLEDALIYDPYDGADPGETRKKIPGLTAIPYGRYRIKFKLSPRFGIVTPELQDVQGFTNILIHPGNYTTDTEGCILVGKGRNGTMLTNSRVAFRELMGLIRRRDDLWIRIQ